MGTTGIASCAVALVLMYTQRRDRRLLARAPLIGAGLICGLLACYAAWRVCCRPGPLDKADGAVFRAVLAAGSGFAVPLLVAWGRAFVRQDVPALVRAIGRAKAWAATCVLLAVLFSAGYFAYGKELGRLGVFTHIDMLFDADPKFHQCLRGVEIHTYAHPLLPALWYVSCTVAALAIEPDWAPLAVSAACGGACVLLGALYFRAISGSRAVGVLGAVMLGWTTAHLTFAAMPESFIVSAAALILLQLLVVWRRGARLRLRHVVLACVLATGVTVTNAAAALVCVLCWGRRPRLGNIARWAAYCLLIGAAFLSVQTLIRPEATLLEPKSYFDEARFLETDVPVEQRLAAVAHATVVQDVVGWIPTTATIYGRPALRASASYDGLGIATIVAWVSMLGLAGWAIVRRRAWRSRTFAAALICLGIAAGLHSQYGYSNLFLYSCCFTFYVLALAAHAASGGRLATILVTAVIGLLLIVNNVRFRARVPAMLGELERVQGWVPSAALDSRTP